MKTSGIDKGSVLVVDDQPDDMEVLIVALQTCGLTILVARQGTHALDLAAQFMPDVILLDVRMPDQEGFETCRRLKAHEAAREIPVIFLLAESDSVDTAKSFEVGGMDYLAKPFQPEEVIARVTAHLTIRKLQQQLQEHDVGTEEKLTFREAVESYEKRLIADALTQNLGNMAKTAASLGIPLRTLYRKIKTYHLR